MPMVKTQAAGLYRMMPGDFEFNGEYAVFLHSGVSSRSVATTAMRPERGSGQTGRPVRAALSGALAIRASTCGSPYHEN
jgi:hypothetical protein